MNRFFELFKVIKPVIGMIHIQALPGTPNNKIRPSSIIDEALCELDIYLKSDIDSIMIENMHDVPYLNRKVGSEITSLMSIIAHEIRKKTTLPLGIQILAGANKEALAIANSAKLDFIRSEGFVFGHIADEGFMNADAGELLRFRKNIDATNVLIFTDIKKKHASHAITNDVNISKTAEAATFFGSDGIIITGKSTGNEINLNELQELRKNVDCPLIAGSGISLENIEKYYNYLDAFIVGSYFKKKGKWNEQLDLDKIIAFMDKIKILRQKE